VAANAGAAVRGAAWARAYRQQARGHLAVFTVLSSQGAASEGRRLHALQMAMEKLAKATFWERNPTESPDNVVNRSHDVCEKHLYLPMREALFPTGAAGRAQRFTAAELRDLLRQIDQLCPANVPKNVQNTEYPWAPHTDAGDERTVLAPVEVQFAVAALLDTPLGRATLKLVTRWLHDEAGG
jgi:hypothetical protein